MKHNMRIRFSDKWQRGHVDGVHRGIEADEICGLSITNIKLCQTQRRKRRHNKSQIGNQSISRERRLQQLIEDGTCQQPDADDIRQRIQLLATGRLYIQRPCSKPIKKIENSGENYTIRSFLVLSLQRKHYPDAAAEQVQAGDKIGNMPFHKAWLPTTWERPATIVSLAIHTDQKLLVGFRTPHLREQELHRLG